MFLVSEDSILFPAASPMLETVWPVITFLLSHWSSRNHMSLKKETSDSGGDRRSWDSYLVDLLLKPFLLFLPCTCSRLVELTPISLGGSGMSRCRRHSVLLSPGVAADSSWLGPSFGFTLCWRTLPCPRLCLFPVGAVPGWYGVQSPELFASIWDSSEGPSWCWNSLGGLVKFCLAV